MNSDHYRKRFFISIAILIVFCIAWYLVPKVLPLEEAIVENGLDELTALSVRAIAAPIITLIFASFVYGFFLSGYVNPLIGAAMGGIFSVIVIAVLVVPFSYLIPEEYQNIAAWIIALILIFFIFGAPIFYLYKMIKN